MRRILVLLLCYLATCANVRAATAPKEALSAMPKGAISLRWQIVSRVPNRAPIAVHLFCRPSGPSKERATMFSEPLKKTPLTRKDIDTGPSIEPSPFWLDIWTPANAAASTWQRLNRVPFTQTKDVQEIMLRWRDPKAKEGPFMALHFGYTHWHEWETFTFTDEWADAPYHRTFYWGGEGDYYVMQRFDKTRNGRMIIEETDGEPNKTTVSIYRWDGREWLDKTQKYFLIAGTFKTQKEAQNWRDKQNWGEVVRSNNYPNLRKGYYIVVLDRFRALKDANERKREIEKDSRNPKLKPYVRRAL